MLFLLLSFYRYCNFYFIFIQLLLPWLSQNSAIRAAQSTLYSFITISKSCDVRNLLVAYQKEPYTVKPRLTSTSVIQSPRLILQPLFFWPPSKNRHHFLVKKNPRQYGQFFDPLVIVGVINGVPLYYLESLSLLKFID